MEEEGWEVGRDMASVATPKAGQPGGGAICLSAALGIGEGSNFISVVVTNILARGSLGVIWFTSPGYNNFTLRSIIAG